MTPRTPTGANSTMNAMVITFNQPRTYGERGGFRQPYTYSRLAARRPWDRRDPSLTGELLLAALCENA